jgi:hypothetical protein
VELLDPIDSVEPVPEELVSVLVELPIPEDEPELPEVPDVLLEPPAVSDVLPEPLCFSGVLFEVSVLLLIDDESSEVDFELRGGLRPLRPSWAHRSGAGKRSRVTAGGPGVARRSGVAGIRLFLSGRAGRPGARARIRRGSRRPGASALAERRAGRRERTSEKESSDRPGQIHRLCLRLSVPQVAPAHFRGQIGKHAFRFAESAATRRRPSGRH